MSTTHTDGLNSAEEMVPKIVQKVHRADEKVVGFVHERPIVALATALAAGYLIGRLFSRLG